MKPKVAILALLCSALVACGGGGGGDSSNPAPEFTTTVKIEGVTVATAPAGKTTTVSMKSGQQIELTSTVPVNFGSGQDTTNGNVATIEYLGVSNTKATFKITVTSAKTVQLTATPEGYVPPQGQSMPQSKFMQLDVTVTP